MNKEVTSFWDVRPCGLDVVTVVLDFLTLEMETTILRPFSVSLPVVATNVPEGFHQ